jgi:lysophospholipase L1-like esterase
MQSKIVKHLCLVSLLAFTAFKLPEYKKIRIYMIGDSTMCTYPVRQQPVTGWGMPFANYFDESVTIVNRARGGRSTRTFIAENLWKPIADSLNAGDYVFIQFGHNDEAKEPQYAARYTPVDDYKKNLIKFITETRGKKAVPILVTPVSRRSFDNNGTARETHAEYTKAVFDIGDQYKVPVIDLDTKSRELYQQLGPLKSKLLFMELDSAEHPNYPVGRHDNTHFNEYGARKMAEIVLNDIKDKKLELTDRMVKGQNKSTVSPQVK